MGALVLLLAAFLPHQRYVEDEADVVEVNHFHDDQAKLVFTQLIWWQWVPWLGEYRVVDWRMARPWAMPRAHHDGFRCRWFDEKDRCPRSIWARFKRETHTWNDPEVDDRQNLPQELRRGLSLP